MEQLNKTTEHKQNLPQSPLVEVTRTFRASVERVWNAWSNAELVKQWWGPNAFTAPDAKTDFRVGGKYLFAMKDTNGKVTWSGGNYQEIVPNKKIVTLDYFADANGNMISAKEAGLPGEWPNELYVTVEFESLNPEQTKMTISHEGIPKDMHDDCVQGWSESIDKLQKLVERN